VRGPGRVAAVDEDALVDPDKSLAEGAIDFPNFQVDSWYWAIYAECGFFDIGLGYLSLDRPSATLSGGESQRLKLVRHLGSSLTGMTYIFDEPSIGLHPHDVHRLNELLVQIRDKGNTVLVVDRLVDGGRVV